MIYRPKPRTGNILEMWFEYVKKKDNQTINNKNKDKKRFYN